MGFLSFLSRANERKRKAQEYEDNQRIVNNSDTKSLSHNEREMIKILKKEKEKALQEGLYWEEQRRQLDKRIKSRNMMTSNFFTKEKTNFFRGGNF